MSDAELFLKALLIIMMGILILSIYQRVRELREESPLVQVKKRAKMWQEKLNKWGEAPDFNRIKDYAMHFWIPEDSIPHALVFSKKEYLYVLSKLYPTSDVSNLERDGYQGGYFSLDTLPCAFHVKRLVEYAFKLKEAIQAMEERADFSPLSHRAQEKLESLQKMLEETDADILNHVYNRKVSEDGYVMSFSKVSLIDEQKLLELVDESLKGAKPHGFNAQPSTSKGITSPALTEIDEFLNEAKLPADVHQELFQTMTRIQEKLRMEEEEKREESIRFQAKALNDTAKEYHQIS